MLASIPHIDQFLGVWAIREEDFQAGYQWFMGADLHLHLQTTGAEVRQAAGITPQLDVRDGVAVIGLYGTLMKQQASMSRSTSTVQTRRALRAAVRNPDVTAILLHVESPGGTAAGTLELAADIAAAAKQKPVYGFAEDLAASAAFWAVSQATKVFANPTAIVGSIGTYGVVTDYSGYAAKEGVKVHVIRAGAMKGAFTPGTEVTAEQLAEQQRIVNDLNDFFVRGVAAGRRLSIDQARELADGRVYVGQAAVDRKLIDGVQSLDDTFTQLAALGRRRSPTMQVHQDLGAAAAAESAITPQTQTSAAPAQASQPPAAATQPRAATLAELKAACPGASNDFLVSQLEAGATLDQARHAWMTKLAADNARLSQETATLKAAAAAPAGGNAAASNTAPGADAVPAGAAASANAAAGGDPISQFEEAVSQLVTDRKLTKARAIQQIAHDQPDLHQAYIAAWNKAHQKVRSRR